MDTSPFAPRPRPSRLAAVCVLTCFLGLASAARAQVARFTLSFDKDGAAETAAGTIKPVTATGVQWVRGHKGQAAFIGANARLAYPNNGALLGDEGAVEMWVKPSWRASDGQNHSLLTDDRRTFKVFKHKSGSLYCQVRLAGRKAGSISLGKKVRWLPDQWHQVVVLWKGMASPETGASVQILVDGKVLGSQTKKGAAARVGKRFYVGADARPNAGFEGVIDGVRIIDKADPTLAGAGAAATAHDPEDYALAGRGATVKCSSELGAFRRGVYLARHVLDGEVANNYWCTDFRKGAKAPHWLDIDLGRPREVGRVLLYMRKGRGTLLTQFKIEAMVGGKWRTLSLAGKDKGAKAVSEASRRYGAPYGVFQATVDPPLTTRRVRVNVTAPAIARLHEIEILPPARKVAEKPLPLATLGEVKKFDFGSVTSPFAEGWAPVTAGTAYTRARGYGWTTAAGLHSVDRLEGYPVVRDMVAGVAEGGPARHGFRVNLPNGSYAVAVVAGDLDFPVGPFALTAEGRPVAPRVGTGARGGWDAQTFTVNVRDGALDLGLEAQEAWALNALLVAPADRFAEVQAEVERIEHEFAYRDPSLKAAFEERLPDARKGRLVKPSEHGPGYEVFTVPIAQPVYPTTQIRQGETTRRLELAAAPGEYEPVTFAIRTAKPLRDFRVKVGDLRGPGRIPSSEVRTYVVRCWPQVTERWRRGERMIVPEMLDPQGRHGDLWVGDGVTKQFWLTWRVPSSAEPGTYRGKVRLTAANTPPVTLDVRLEVLPIRLRWPEPMALGIYYYFHRDWGDPRILADLRDMRSNGLHMLCVSLGSALVGRPPEMTWDFSHLRWVMGLLKQVDGFTGPFPVYIKSGVPRAAKGAERVALIQRLIRALEAERKKQGWPEILYYLHDEPFRGEKLKAAKPDYEAAKGVPGIRTYCTVSGLAADTMGKWVDVRCHTLTASNGFYWPKVYESAVRNEDEFWWYSNATRHYFDCMRMKAGFFHWKVRATGQTYWHYRAPSNTAFCDFDSRARDHVAVYPGLDGPIRTIQWECHREGLDDARYVYTLELLIADAKKAGVDAAAIAKAQGVVDALGKRTIVDMDYYDKKFPNRKYAFHYYCDWPPAQFDQERARLAQAILALQKAMK